MLVLTQKQRRRNEPTYEEIHITYLPTKEVMVVSTEKAFDGKARLGFAGSKELFEVKRVTVGTCGSELIRSSEISNREDGGA